MIINTNTVKWFNASYAILTEINKWDYNRFGGLPANEETKAEIRGYLDDWWGVTDRESADETVEWLLTEGHRIGFAEDMRSMEEDGIEDIPEDQRAAFLLDNYDMDEDTAKFRVKLYPFYEKYGDHAIDGWDYCRTLNLAGFYYIAGYYTEQEALDLSMETAEKVQKVFESWDELVESYMRGYEYWMNKSADKRRAVYADLKTRRDNPYAVDYMLVMTKSW